VRQQVGPAGVHTPAGFCAWFPLRSAEWLFSLDPLGAMLRESRDVGFEHSTPAWRKGFGGERERGACRGGT
jgi:hypothetical protein